MEDEDFETINIPGTGRRCLSRRGKVMTLEEENRVVILVWEEERRKAVAISAWSETLNDFKFFNYFFERIMENLIL